MNVNTYYYTDYYIDCLICNNRTENQGNWYNVQFLTRYFQLLSHLYVYLKSIQLRTFWSKVRSSDRKSRYIQLTNVYIILTNAYSVHHYVWVKQSSSLPYCCLSRRIYQEFLIPLNLCCVRKHGCVFLPIPNYTYEFLRK